MMAGEGTALHIKLTTAQGALVLEALAELPFKTVFELIGELNHQATSFGKDDTSEAHEFTFRRVELALIVKALGELPYSRVHVLLAGLGAQIAEQG